MVPCFAVTAVVARASFYRRCDGEPVFLNRKKRKSAAEVVGDLRAQVLTLDPADAPRPLPGFSRRPLRDLGGTRVERRRPGVKRTCLERDDSTKERSGPGRRLT
jgi:hypothetical protein